MHSDMTGPDVAPVPTPSSSPRREKLLLQIPRGRKVTTATHVHHVLKSAHVETFAVEAAGPSHVNMMCAVGVRSTLLLRLCIAVQVSRQGAEAEP